MSQNYRLYIAEKAKLELEVFFEYYFNISHKVHSNFLNETRRVTNKIATNPNLYTKRYKDFRRINYSRFPIMLSFVVDEELKSVKILACHHQKSNPINFYKNK